MTKPSTKDHMQGFLQLGSIALALLCTSGLATATRHQNRRYYYSSSISRPTRTWGIQSNAKLTSTSEERDILDFYLMNVRGGSDYPGGNPGGYDDDDRYGSSQGNYDRYNLGADRWGGHDRYKDDRGSSRDNYDEYAHDPYDDRGSVPSRSRNAESSPLSGIQSKLKNGDRRIGVPLMSLGVVFIMLGISLFFNKALMRLGNLMLIAGVPVSIGPTRTMGYFFRPEKSRATGCLAAGIFLVFVGWPISGMALEAFGILNLFGNMFPVFWAIFKNMPFVSTISKNPGSGTRRPSSYEKQDRYSPDRDPYYEDRRGYDDYERNDDGGTNPYY